MRLKTIKIEGKFRRVLIPILGILGLIYIVFSLKWSFGNVFASHSENIELAELSVMFAPDDPQAHFASAVLYEKTFLPEDREKALHEYKKAAALTPFNYLVWLELGKALEGNGMTEAALTAFIKAEELAPNYALVKWTAGNFHLRRGNISEGFSKIRHAAGADEKFINPFLSLTWQYFGDDPNKLREISGDARKLKAATAVFLTHQNEFDAALEIWNSLSAGENNQEFAEQGEAIYAALIAAKRYQQALQVRNSYAASDKIEIGKIQNGGFENEIGTEKADFFGWAINPGLLPQIGFDDSVKKAGGRSLVYIFNSNNGTEFRQAAQNVVVKEKENYSLRFFYKSELKTDKTLKCVVTDLSGQKVLAESEPLTPAADWTEVNVNFTAGENTQAVTIILSREDCKSPICPITGKIWFDEFALYPENN